MLQGDAKRDYMRDYMRRKRAGEPTRNPKPAKPAKRARSKKPARPWQPTQRMVREVHHWFYLQKRRSWDLRGIGRDVVRDLDPETGMDEAQQRYRTLRAERRADRKRTKEILDEPPPPKCCSFCGQSTSEDRPLFGDGRFDLICERCAKKAVAASPSIGRPHHEDHHPDAGVAVADRGTGRAAAADLP